MSLDLTGLKNQIAEGWKELAGAHLPPEGEMPWLVLCRWRAVEAQVQQLRNAISELVLEPAKEHLRLEVKAKAREKADQQEAA